MYGVRLWVDLDTPRLTWREFKVLLNGLPDRSRFRLAVTDGESSWGPTEHLLALVVDVLQISNWQRASSKKNPRPKPKPIDRPRDIAERRRKQLERRERWADFKERARARRERVKGG